MDFAGFVENYGYLAVALGTFFEGEAILLVAGFAAYRGHLALPTVMAVATIASFLGDQVYFHLGRRYGPAMLARCPSVQSKAARVKALLHRHHLPLILSLRLLYGLRTPGLIAIGMSHVSPVRFFVLSFISAVVWAIVITAAGYGFGHTLERLVAELGYYETAILAVILLCGSLSFVLFRRRRAAALKKQS